MIHNKQTLLSRCALFAAAMIWGASFFIIKNSLDGIGPSYLNAFRNTIGFLLLGIIFCKRLWKKTDRKYILHGAIVGLCYFLGTILQNIGMAQGTSPGKSSFLTAVYCVIVPFLYWLIYRKRPDIYNFLAALLCITGIGMVALTDSFTIAPGDVFTLLGGFFFAAHILALMQFTQGRDPIVLSIYQFVFAALFSWIAGLLFEPFPTTFNPDMIGALLYLSVCGTALGLCLQSVGQKYTNPNTAAIILSLESVFGVLFSVIFYHEILTLRLIIGFLLIFIAVVVSETKLSFLRRKQTT